MKIRLTDALVNSSDLEKKGKDKREKVKLQKEFTKKVNDLFAEKAAISMLTECESKRKYHRKRMSQSFHSPQEQPDFSKVSWESTMARRSLSMYFMTL